MRLFTIIPALVLAMSLVPGVNASGLNRSLGVGYGAGYHAGACGDGGGGGGGYLGCCDYPLPHHDHLWADYCATRGHGLFGGSTSGCGTCCESEPSCDDGCRPRFSLKGLLSRCRDYCEPICCEPEPSCDACCGRRFSLKKLFSWPLKSCPHDACCSGAIDEVDSGFGVPLDEPGRLPLPPVPMDVMFQDFDNRT